MDSRVVAWARAVKARSRRMPGAVLPVLWLFTDPLRLADPRQAVARLPRGMAGVVFRHDAAVGRARLGADLAAICRARRLAMVVAGDPRLAARLGAGLHLRGGRRDGWRGWRLPRGALVTASAHSDADLRRAARSGCHAAFLSPVFPTASHPGAGALGVVRWRRLATSASLPVFALGGVTGAVVASLSRTHCRGTGAIGALL